MDAKKVMYKIPTGAIRMHCDLFLETKKEHTAWKLIRRLQSDLSMSFCDLKVSISDNHDELHKGKYRASFFLYQNPWDFLNKANVIGSIWQAIIVPRFFQFISQPAKYIGVELFMIEWEIK